MELPDNLHRVHPSRDTQHLQVIASRTRDLPAGYRTEVLCMPAVWPAVWPAYFVARYPRGVAEPDSNTEIDSVAVSPSVARVPALQPRIRTIVTGAAQL